jgi:hypothetical protein
LDLRRKIDGVDIIANENEIWFLQGGRICWTTREEVWSGSSRVGEMLRRRGYTVQAKRFPKKLRELILTISKPGRSEMVGLSSENG